MRVCCLVSVKGDGDENVIERELSGTEAGTCILVVATGEATSIERQFAGRCQFAHLLPGDFLFDHVKPVRRALAYSNLEPAEQDEVTAAVIYGNLRYYYPVKAFLMREGITRLRVAKAQPLPLATERTVIAAAEALGIIIEERRA
jgi:hypothetical protein